MKKLTPEQVKQHDEIYGRLEEVTNAVDNMVSKINKKIMDELGPLVTQFDAVADEANVFITEVVGKMDEYIEARPENWGETEEGNNYATWKDEWESAELARGDRVFEIDSPIDDNMTENFGALESHPE